MLCGISPGFPELFPTRGQVVTCYSPGRRFTHGLLHFLARLACVRHAASVDSEPGSNSRLKPEICSERTNSPSARRPTAYFVSTFRLLARTFPSHPPGNRSPRNGCFRADPKVHATSQLARSTFLSKIEIACSAETAKHFLPPERCVFNPHGPKSVRPRNSLKLSRRRKRCQPTDITGFPPVFNSVGRLDPSLVPRSI